MSDIVILGVFVADTAYRAPRQPRMGETILGTSFALGPGGKGANQSVAAAKAGGNVTFITKLGRDPFADMALATWKAAGVKPAVTQMDDDYTGAATTISAADMDARKDLIAAAKVFVTQLEQPLPAALRALEIAKAAGVTTILN